MTISKLEIPVQGMTCANCAARINKELNSLDGIEIANVNLATDFAYIEFDKDKIQFDIIKQSIEKLGYKVFSSSENYQHNDLEKEQDIEVRNEKIKFFTSLLLSIPIMLFGMDIIPLPDTAFFYFSKVIFLFIATSVVMFFSGKQFFIGFYKSMKNLYADMNTLVAIGTSVAYFYSIYLVIISYMNNGHNHVNHLYFDTSSTIITFILLGKLLEKKTRRRSSESIKNLLNLQPKEVNIRRDNLELFIPVEYVRVDDIIIIKPGEKIPVDGMIIKGSSTIDESLVTGESLPVEKVIGDNVTGGTINKFGSIEFKATKVGKDTYLSGIIELVKNSQNAKIKIQKYADKIASYFVPAVVFTALVTFFIWLFIIPSGNLSFALMNAVSVLIISCPCALGLATPTAIITGIGKAAESGIYFRNSETLETVKELNTVIFDKTGTITTGEIKVSKIIGYGLSENDILLKAASIEKMSEHPIGTAIYKKLLQLNLKIQDVEYFSALSGFGLKGRINSKEYFLGNMELMKNLEIEINNDILNDYSLNLNNGYIVVFIAEERNIIGLILLEDTIKPDSYNLIKKLKKNNYEIYLLTGDHRISAERIAGELGFDKIIADVRPEDKLRIIKEMQEKGRNVAMIGDGINDAPALSQANIGIALGSGTDVAINSADITISGDEIDLVYSAINISQKTMNIIKQNLFWAFFYNLICIPIAAGVLYPFNGFVLNPAIASLAMAFSSVSVVLNSLRLKTIKIG